MLILIYHASDIQQDSCWAPAICLALVWMLRLAWQQARQEPCSFSREAYMLVEDTGNKTNWVARDYYKCYS